MKAVQNSSNQDSKRNVAGLVVLSAVILFGIVAGNFLGPEIISKYVVVSETEREARIWQTRVLRLLDKHELTFEKGSLAEVDHVSLSHFVASSNVFRLRLFDRQGKLFWSSGTQDQADEKSSQIGNIGAEPFFKSSLLHGAIHHASGFREARHIEGFAEEHTGISYDDRQLRQISEIFIPVMLGGRMIGVVEHFRDITDALHVSKFRLQVAALIVSAALIIMWVTAIVSMVLYQRRSRRLLEHQRVQEQAAAAIDQRRNREIKLLSELNEWLQSCKSLDELYEMVSAILSRMFPDSSGSLYVYSNSRDVLEGACNWHDGVLVDEIRPDDCWGLRRGRAYTFGGNEIDFACSHANEDGKKGYICIPIVAHGDTIGMMHLVSDGFARQGRELTKQGVEERKLALMCAEQISLAIANVRLRDQLHNQSIRDSLTGLYNRRHFNEVCRNLVTSSKRRGEQFGLISFDVDHFKLFNDNHGHDAGDMVLRAVGDALDREFDGDDLAFRTGGEEFAVLLPELDETAALERAEGLRKIIEAVVVRYGDRALPRITISAGIAIYPVHGDMPQHLVRSADEALYEAKGKGRNQVCVAQANGNDPQDRLAPADKQASEEDFVAAAE